MAIEPRKRAKGKVVYGVSLDPPGGPRVWELVGPNRRLAEEREHAIKRELKAGTYVPKVERKRYTVGEFCDVWSEARKNAWADDERDLIRLHVKSRAWLSDKPLDETKPKDADRLIDEMRATPKRCGRPGEMLSDGTIANVIGILKLVFNKAMREEHCIANPIVLEPNKLKRRPKEEEVPYTPAEALTLMEHHSIPWGMRVLNSMCLLTGMRQGEAAARRWRDLEATCGPLDSIHIHNQWEDLPLKTERPRRAPIHPDLAATLSHWAREGFELYMGRTPQPDDYIVPNTSPRATRGQHTRSSFYKNFVKYAVTAGVDPHTQHVCRHTFLTELGRSGGNKAIFEKITHNARGDIIDRYTHIDWEPLCQQVLLVDLHARRDPPPGSGNGGKNRSGPLSHLSAIYLDAAKPALHAAASIPGASTTFPHKTSHFARARQEIRQDFEWNHEEIRGSNRLRKRGLLSLAEADWKAAKPGLCLARALDAAYRLADGRDGAREKLDGYLLEAADALGFTDGPVSIVVEREGRS